MMGHALSHATMEQGGRRTEITREVTAESARRYRSIRKILRNGIEWAAHCHL